MAVHDDLMTCDSHTTLDSSAWPGLERTLSEYSGNGIIVLPIITGVTCITSDSVIFLSSKEFGVVRVPELLSRKARSRLARTWAIGCKVVIRSCEISII